MHLSNCHCDDDHRQISRHHLIPHFEMHACAKFVNSVIVSTIIITTIMITTTLTIIIIIITILIIIILPVSTKPKGRRL